MKHSRFGLMFAAMIATTAAAQQAPAQLTYKIGFVNTERVMTESRVAVEAKKSLEAEFQKRDKEISAGPPAELDRRRRALLEDMSQRRDEVLKQLVDKANALIKRIAEEEKMDAVFIEAAYYDPRIDITPRVIKALDAGR